MDALIYILVAFIAAGVLLLFFEIIYLIHPFRCLVWFYHGIMGHHRPKEIVFYDGCSIHSRCRFCNKEIVQDSQGNWFTFN